MGLLLLGAVPCQTSLFAQDTCSGSSILANARLWGVQIVHVDGILLCYAGIQWESVNLLLLF